MREGCPEQRVNFFNFYISTESKDAPYKFPVPVGAGKAGSIMTPPVGTIKVLTRRRKDELRRLLWRSLHCGAPRPTAPRYLTPCRILSAFFLVASFFDVSSTV
jgi:hypothetical protein